MCLCPENLPVEKQLDSSATAGFNLSWDEQDTATCGYTVEWCVLGTIVPCTLRWMNLPKGNNTLFLPARKFLFCCFPLVSHLMHLLNVSSFSVHCHTFVLQEISKQVVGIYLISMDAQKMDTAFWRYRLDTHKSSVSVITDK